MRLHKVGILCLILLLFSNGTSAKIVFSSMREGVEGVYVMDDDGSNQKVLTESAELQPFPNCWSPDGQQILFKRRAEPHKSFVLFLMNADGTNIRQLTQVDGSSIGKVSFAPDGKSIVFNRIVRIDDEEKPSITILNIKTRKMKEILNLNATFCDWSPDGKHILFSKPVAVGGGGNTIWIMDVDRRNPRPLIPEPARDPVIIHRWKQRWSPDGKKIVYIQNEYTWERIPNVGTALIYKAHRYMICDQNGENIKQLPIPKDWYPISIDWMDDGESVVFSAQVGIPLNKLIQHGFVFPPANIYKYHIPTGVRTQLTEHPGEDDSIDWISDDVLSVTPHGKKKVTWGTLKQLGSESYQINLISPQ